MNTGGVFSEMMKPHIHDAFIALFVLKLRRSALASGMAMKQSFKASQARLFELAETQGGFFTAQQAESSGFDRTHHSYHVRTGNWHREARGVYRLSRFPSPERPDLVRWSLWSRNRVGETQGVYSHQTALSIHDLSDLMPAKLHLTVPRAFRRQAAIPAILVLHFDDVPAGDVEVREGYRVTSPIRTIRDASKAPEISGDIIRQAVSEAITRGLIIETDIDRHRDWLGDFLPENRVSASA